KGPRRKPPPDVARELNVDAIVEGSVQRAGRRVHINAQLIYAPTNTHLWANQYDGDARDVLAVQSQVALAIAGEVQATLTPRDEKRLKTPRRVDPQAHEAYLRGLFEVSDYTLESIPKGLAQFERAIKRDPDYAQAYGGLALGYLFARDLILPAREADRRMK